MKTFSVLERWGKGMKAAVGGGSAILGVIGSSSGLPVGPCSPQRASCMSPMEG